MIPNGIIVNGMNVKTIERKPSLRERIVEAAYGLFDAQGIQHVTVEAIAAAAQTTKMGVYRHFPSKDVLIEAWLDQTIARYRSMLDVIEQRHPGRPRAQLWAFADAVAADLPQISHRGCPYVNTIAEIADRDHPWRQRIEAHKTRQAQRLEAICRAAGLADPAGAAAHITFVLEGAQISAQNGSIAAIDRHIAAIMATIIGQRPHDMAAE